ncbi:transmembrane protein, putative (macronuclear) [Tetrahymena thermophila SB210]|uniref:Transmembrane protein, putative n=1 Tax=Tetrahymena thermophila (strain SB210) TaxID=312017 RepID=Q237J7_TETTS|nr:transmembrane protein, putative [Tetrahymena thermophila SB210]EAR92744.2 transmembrane protein, putative [Tetrahymena thermophila SB210]|eukprot:XP_001012989.2 transmembrane protein, putative [Tetrahymena thermophila SB210]
MDQNFDGILSQFYQNNTILLLQGSPEIINSYLIQNLSIYSNQTIRQQYIQFKLSDKLDYDWQSQFTYDQVQFIWYKKNITNIKTIQDLYSQKYPNGLQVETEFQLSININDIYSFHPTLTLKIQAYFDENQKEELPQNCINSWICFDGQILSGFASLNQYDDQYKIYFLVTDGYELHDEILLLDFSIYSTKQILKISAIISGILFIILMCYIFRQNIQRIFFYNYYLHQTEYVHNSEDGKIYKKLFLRQFNWKMAHKIFVLLKESFRENELAKIVDFDGADDDNQDKFSTFYLNYINQIGDLNEEEFITDCISIIQKNQNLFHNLQLESLKKNNSELREALISIFFKYALYTDQNSFYVYTQIKNHFMIKSRGINWYKNLVNEKKILFQQNNQQKLQNYEESSSNTKGDNTQKSSEDTQQSRISYQDLQINNEELKKCLSELKQQEKHKFGLDYDIKIIQNAIKSDYFGFDYIFDLKTYRQCFGESLHINNQQIGEILCYKKELKNILDNDFKLNYQKSNKLSQIFDNLNLGYKRYPIVLSKIEDQKEVSEISYDIELDSITFKIDLENLSQGQYKIQLFNTQKYLIFQFSFLILFKCQISDYKKKIKMFTFSSSQNIFQQQNQRKNIKNLTLPKKTTNSKGSHKFGFQKGINLSLQSIIKRPNNLRRKEKNSTLKFEDDSFNNNNDYENVDF